MPHKTVVGSQGWGLTWTTSCASSKPPSIWFAFLPSQGSGFCKRAMEGSGPLCRSRVQGFTYFKNRPPNTYTLHGTAVNHQSTTPSDRQSELAVPLVMSGIWQSEKNHQIRTLHFYGMYVPYGICHSIFWESQKSSPPDPEFGAWPWTLSIRVEGRLDGVRTGPPSP